MNQQEREAVIDEDIKKLNNESDKLFKLEQQKKVDTPYYKSLLEAFEKHLEYHRKICQRHIKLCRESGTKK